MTNKSSASEVSFRPLDDLFEPTDGSGEKPLLTELTVDTLVPFEKHPFKEYPEEKMQEMVESVSEYGVLMPILVRPHKSGEGYEIISGHNRVEACKRAGITRIPATVRELDDDTAVIIMVDSNLRQRDKLLPSEKAKA
ncbi:MAG: ParB/RepB/Spo0J family partition protein [Clostridia bacterium]|nr:ParB/RepB/Spo0J family partition protein [Clostridia bacterium]